VDATIDLPRPSRRHPRSPWSAARLRHLRRRWAQGASAARIARELGGGVSRSAVLGKLHRLGIARLSPAARGRRPGLARIGVEQ
jgi:GcrA cell cycle regulator